MCPFRSAVGTTASGPSATMPDARSAAPNETRKRLRQHHASRCPARAGFDLAATAIAAGDGGCSTFALMDHWFQMELLGAWQDPMLDPCFSDGRARRSAR